MSNFEQALKEFTFDLNHYSDGVAIPTGENSQVTEYRRENNEFSDEIRGKVMGAHAYSLADDPDGYVAGESAGRIIAITEEDEVIERMEIEDMGHPEAAMALRNQFVSQEAEEYGERLHEIASNAATSFSDISNQVSDWKAVEYGQFNGVESDRIIVGEDFINLHGSSLSQASSLEVDLQSAMYSELESEYDENTDLDLEDPGRLNELASENPGQYRDVIEAGVLGKCVAAVQNPRTELLAGMDNQISGLVRHSRK